MALIDIYSNKPSQKQSVPFPIFVTIYVKDYSSDKGRVLLSPQLATDQEVDGAVDCLINQLEKARQKAKKLLTK